MTITHLYLYDETKTIDKMVDYGDYISVADRDERLLNDTIGTYSCKLLGISKSKEFSPSTKFILTKELDGHVYIEKHLMVQIDLVEKPILSVENYYNHDITFNEASVVAQKRICDNISNTYKLQDVSLDISQQIDVDSTANKVRADVNESTMGNYTNRTAGIIVEHPYMFGGTATEETITAKRRFEIEFDTAQEQSTFNDIKLLTSLGTNQTQNVTIPIPEIKCYQQNANGVYEFQGYCSVDVIVKEIAYGATSFADATVTTTTINPANNTWQPDILLKAMQSDLAISDNDLNAFRGCVVGTIDYKQYGGVVPKTKLIKLKKIADNYGVSSTRSVDVLMRTEKKYQITICVHDFSNSVPSLSEISYNSTDFEFANFDNTCPYFFTKKIRTHIKRDIRTNKLLEGDISGVIMDEAPMQRIEYGAYNPDKGKVLYWSAPRTNAYQLFIKSIFASHLVHKTYGITNAVPYYELELPFYVSDDWRAILEATETIENLYNQKNLWEMFLEIGKYIHCVPIIKFGTNGRFLVDWRELGSTTRGSFENTRKSIYNSRQIENYVATCQSYVTNLVQLGGAVEEYIVPKSSSEDYLVYNDVAELHTSKPIQEILDLKVRCVNSNAGISASTSWYSLISSPNHKNGFIFEKGIYQLFDEDDSGLNKGDAIYYELGSNIIQGLNYQLPSKTVGSSTIVYDYAIKRILKKIYGQQAIEANIRVNDFMFYIKYRTVEEARITQTRPDLRKYLLNCPLDEYPRHDQFCNQQDVLIDSEKFGNFVFGKLVRTGNTEYKKLEWVDDISQIKQIGDLYTLDDGNLYYVYKVSNTYYPDHVESLVEFSKDYNQLSEVIGIPSEPRFYEISERSLIPRELNISHRIVVSTERGLAVDKKNSFAIDIVDLYEILFQNADYPNYAITIFKNDKFDTSDTTVAGNSNFYRDVILPVNVTTNRGTMSFSWEMADNFSAGDYVTPTNEESGVPNKAYNKLTPYQYPDPHGRAQLFDFILTKIDLSDKDVKYVQMMPENIYDLRNVTRVGQMTALANSVSNALTFNDIPTSAEITAELQARGFEGDPYVGLSAVVAVVMSGGTDYYTAVFGAQYEWTLTQWQNTNEFERMPVVDEFGHANFNTIISSGEGARTKNGYGYVVLKDNREALRFNVNIEALTDSDRFVISNEFWSNQKQDYALVLLSEEVNKLNNGTIDASNIIDGENGYYAITIDYDTEGSTGIYEDIKIHIDSALSLAGLKMINAKAIAIVYKTNLATTLNRKNFVIARNIDGLVITRYDDEGNLIYLDVDEARKDWFVRHDRASDYRNNATEE